jgi:hypothetical protein
MGNTTHPTISAGMSPARRKSQPFSENGGRKVEFNNPPESLEPPCDTFFEAFACFSIGSTLFLLSGTNVTRKA